MGIEDKDKAEQYQTAPIKGKSCFSISLLLKVFFAFDCITINFNG